MGAPWIRGRGPVGALAASALLAPIALPALAHALLPVEAPDGYAERVNAAVFWGRALGIALGAGALALVGMRLRRDAPRGRRNAAALALAAAAVCLVAALPAYDAAASAALAREYGDAMRVPGWVEEARIYRSFHGRVPLESTGGLFFDHTNRTGEDGLFVLGPYSAEKGDRWTVHVSSRGPFEGRYVAPVLMHSDAVACEKRRSEIESYEKPAVGELAPRELSFHEQAWRCTSLASGGVSFRVSPGAGAGGGHVAGAVAYPSYALHARQVADTSLLLVASALAAGAVLALLAHRATECDPLAEGAAAAALAGACAFWPLLVGAFLLTEPGHIPVRGDAAALTLVGAWTLGALATVALALGAARRWAARDAERATDLGRLASLGATLVLPLGPFPVVGLLTESLWAALAHVGVGLLLAGVAVWRWWRGVRLRGLGQDAARVP